MHVWALLEDKRRATRYTYLSPFQLQLNEDAYIKLLAATAERVAIGSYPALPRPEGRSITTSTLAPIISNSFDTRHSPGA